jgi:hypothetical protein
MATHGATQAAGLITIKQYIENRMKIITAYVINTDIFNECLKSTPSPSNSSQILWWKDLENEEVKETIMNENVINNPEKLEGRSTRAEP